MKTTPPSLPRLLDLIEFSPYDPASAQDATHRVFVMPRPSERAEHFDALVTITPHDPDAAPPAGETLTARPRAGTSLAPMIGAKTNTRGQAWLRELPFGDYGLGCGEADALAVPSASAAAQGNQSHDRVAAAKETKLGLAASSADPDDIAQEREKD